MNFQQQKERQDMILEPLQVMIQLSLVSFCPLGTKVSISNNIFSINLFRIVSFSSVPILNVSSPTVISLCKNFP